MMSISNFFVISAIFATVFSGMTVSALVKTDVDVQAGTGISVGVGGVELDAEMNTGKPAEARGWDAKEKKELVVKRADTGAKKRATVTIATDPTAITSVDDLEALAASVIEAYASVALVKLTLTETQVDYRIPGKLFGVIPVRALVHVWLDTDGRVKVKYPWYAIFVKKLVRINALELETEVKTAVESNPLEDVVVRQARGLQALTLTLGEKVGGRSTVQKKTPAGTGLIIGRNAIYVAEQPTGTTVGVNLAVLARPGFVVIHEELNGKAGAVIGASNLLAVGETQDIGPIQLSRVIRDAEEFTAMLHLDDGDGVFDAATDLPVPDDQGNIIEMHFGVGAEAQAGGEVSL